MCSFEMKEAEIAANYLQNHETAIINQWELRVRSELEAAEQASSLVLRNHLARLMGDVREYLRRTSSSDRLEEAGDAFNASISVFEKHGRERATTDNYDEDQLIWECVLLRRVVVDELLKNNLANMVIVERITRFFETVAWAAVSSFSESIKATHKKIIASLVHDIRNPLSAIGGSTHLLAHKNPDGQAQELLQSARQGLHRIGSILNEVLDNANIEAGSGLHFVFEECDFLEDLEVIRKETEAIYGSRFKYEVDAPSGHMKAVLDSALLVRLLENLIANAFKHGSHNGSVLLSAHDETDRLKLCVHNTGEPIPQEKQKRIFDFLNTTKGSAGGKSYGIGLALAKATAEGHKGAVQLESTKDKGTTFTLIIPKFAHKPSETLTMIL
jgi:signal transduction histidine kinase